MSKYLILFNAPEPMGVFMVRSTPQERQAGLEAWKKWRAQAEKTVKFEFGAVVQSIGHIAQGEVTENSNQASNYAFAEGNSKVDVINALKNHPHLQRTGATIDILEILNMPS